MTLRKRKIQYTPPIWKYEKDDKKFSMLFHSMLKHKSFISLSDKAKTIYLYMTDYSNGKYEFTYPYSIYKNISSKPTFINCIKELEQHGFIEVKFCGKHTRTENIYTFSSKWKNYK